MYEREEHYSKVAPDGTTETRIVKERYSSGFGEFALMIALISLGIIAVSMVSANIHQRQAEKAPVSMGRSY